ncbi:hypothetical protein [Pontibacter actiniarum]|uniref:Uncharacterized protein n=1 Tax=Pontibacter actiniarum TaxID=323450 RepID=A0A1X9YS82_9BACT|nr:hypothetical protein [Pontibacter actiniarum]ARS35756.1 hypothetical protein CA264_10055 [Pontibacter actiniarum]
MWDIYLHFALLLANLLLWGACYRSLLRPLRVLGATLALTLLLEGYAAYLMWHLMRNLYLYHLLTPVQYAGYALVFYQALKPGLPAKAIRSSIPLFLLVSLFFALLQGTDTFNSYASSLKHLLLAGCALMYYYDIFTHLSEARLHTAPLFWVSTGLLFHSLGNFFLYGLMNTLLVESFELAHLLYYFSEFLGYLLYLTFLIAFLLGSKQALRPAT